MVTSIDLSNLCVLFLCVCMFTFGVVPFTCICDALIIRLLLYWFDVCVLLVFTFCSYLRVKFVLVVCMLQLLYYFGWLFGYFRHVCGLFGCLDSVGLVLLV